MSDAEIDTGTRRELAEPAFAPLPAAARPSYVWAAPLLALMFLTLANLPAVPFLLASELIPGVGLTAQFWLLVIGVALTFLLLAGAAIFWAKVFEKRGLATMGLAKADAWRYWRGAGLGVVLAAVLLTISAMFSPETVAPTLQGLPRLMTAEGLTFLIVFLFMFALQGASEEVTFRGWMISSIAARRGQALGVVISSVAFALVHAHYLVFAPLTGILVVGAVMLIGVVFAFWALAERSAWGVCGAHGAYNYILIVVATAQALGEDPEFSPMQVAVSAFVDITQITEYDPSLPATLAVLALLSLAAGAVWRRRRQPA